MLRALALALGYLNATVHRVVSPPVGVERISSGYFVNPCLDAALCPIALPAHLAAEAPGGASAGPTNPIFATCGENILKMRVRTPSRRGAAAPCRPDRRRAPI
ncbi:hypothetical protein [Streptomyces sp. CA-106131]|uniref:hypothetical protein n=1 Tax=Streptomyces sp. CA-106131 TaxID=3240045 RepID=UPI003D8D8EBB